MGVGRADEDGRTTNDDQRASEEPVRPVAIRGSKAEVMRADCYRSQREYNVWSERKHQPCRDKPADHRKGRLYDRQRALI